MDIKPRLREFEQEYWQILATATGELAIAEPDAEVIVAEIVESVGRIETQSEIPAEVRQVFLELRDKLNQPGTPAAQKMKWALSAMPPFVQVSGEGDLNLDQFTNTYFPTFRQWAGVWAKTLAKKF